MVQIKKEQLDADERFIEVCRQIEENRNALLSILNELRIGTVMIDSAGNVIFLSRLAGNIIGTTPEDAKGVHWEKLLPLKHRDRANIKNMFSLPLLERDKVTVAIDGSGGRRYVMEVEVHDDPMDMQRKILFLYDMSEVYDLRRFVDGSNQFLDFIGKSRAMIHVYRQIEEIAHLDWTVLIEGDTGTGKELVARAIHAISHRKDKPFIAVNCAGLTDSLLSSQLFGHKRGAFTGAVSDHIGVFEAADGGTIFLDEIGDVSQNVQTSLLRVLENREITRLGEAVPIKINVRVVTATNRSLIEEVKNNKFRQDLFYRIRIARVGLPPLIERREDIPLLAAAFLARAKEVTGKAVTDLSTDAMRLLLEYDWPGNVRELKSAIEFSVISCKTSVIQPSDLPPEIRVRGGTFSSITDIAIDKGEQIVMAIKKANGNKTAAAKLLGMSRATLYRHLVNIKQKQGK